MYDCEQYEFVFPCFENDHEKFNSICRDELKEPVTVAQIMAKSSFCVELPIGVLDKYEDIYLSVNEHLQGLRNKVGLYGLWIRCGYCNDHEKYEMECAYVGKGHALKRVKTHIQEKWPHAVTLYVTFYECENRIAKYLEQLLLDTYNFPLNKEENKGTGSLFCSMIKRRIEDGTEQERLIQIFMKKHANQLDNEKF